MKVKNALISMSVSINVYVSALGLVKIVLISGFCVTINPCLTG